MKALLFKKIGEISLEDVRDPRIKEDSDAIVRLTRSAICGTDLHLIRGTMTGMKRNTILGHEGVGVIEKVGKNVNHLKIGDRVIVPSTLGCGECANCQKKLYALCDHINPNGPEYGTVFFGGPKNSGSFNGMQAEKVRVPFADKNLIKIPDEVSDDQAILISDILPTAYMAVENAFVKSDDKVAVFGCGPVGQLVIFCLKQKGVKEIFAIDRIQSRLNLAEEQGAKVINFDEVNPVNVLKELTNKKGPTKIIDAVGIDAEHPSGMHNQLSNLKNLKQFKKELKEVAPKQNEQNGNWKPGNAPSQVLQWAAQAIAKNGVISIIGVYPEALRFFPIGQIFSKNITVTMGDCNHYKYIPIVLKYAQEGKLDPSKFITQKIKFDQIIDAYKNFDKRKEGFIKVVLTFE